MGALGLVAQAHFGVATRLMTTISSMYGAGVKGRRGVRVQAGGADSDAEECVRFVDRAIELPMRISSPQTRLPRMPVVPRSPVRVYIRFIRWG